jgi:hypothetical protein
LITGISGGVTTYSHDTTYYTYDAGKLVADSLRGNDGYYYQSHHYTYFPGQIEASSSYLGATPASARDGHDVYIGSFSNGNLMHEIDTVMFNYISSGLPAQQWMAYDYTFTYTNNPDPLYRVVRPIKRLYYNEGDWVWDNNIPLFINPNLPSSTYRIDDQWNTAGTGSSAHSTATGNYSYSFRADGYPLIMRQVDHEYGPYDRYFKLLYEYNR